MRRIQTTMIMLPVQTPSAAIAYARNMAEMVLRSARTRFSSHSKKKKFQVGVKFHFHPSLSQGWDT